jgi:hypothetical protein
MISTRVLVFVIIATLCVYAEHISDLGVSKDSFVSTPETVSHFYTLNVKLRSSLVDFLLILTCNMQLLLLPKALPI